MTVNAELLQKTLDTIKANPQHWDQTKWHCGTSHCFAGLAELIANNVPIETHEDDLCDFRKFYDSHYDRWKTGNNAAELLGLSKDDARALFAAWNCLDSLEQMVNDLIKFGTLFEENEEQEDES